MLLVVWTCKKIEFVENDDVGAHHKSDVNI